MIINTKEKHIAAKKKSERKHKKDIKNNTEKLETIQYDLFTNRKSIKKLENEIINMKKSNITSNRKLKNIENKLEEKFKTIMEIEANKQLKLIQIKSENTEYANELNQTEEYKVPENAILSLGISIINNRIHEKIIA